MAYREKNKVPKACQVAKLSNGKIGYLHLPDTYLGSAVEFPKYFYSQMAKQGMNYREILAHYYPGTTLLDNETMFTRNLTSGEYPAEEFNR